MCQMNLYMEKDGKEELLLEDVIDLSVDDKMIKVSTLFEGPREMSGTIVRSIDFMAGKVILESVD